MYSRDVMGEKRQKMSFFWVVTKISTRGDTLKLGRSTFLKHHFNGKYHKNYEFITQIAMGRDNKGHIVDFPNFSFEKTTFFSQREP